MKKILIGIGIAIVLIAIVAGSVIKARSNKGKAIHADKPARRDLFHVVKASGKIDPRVKVDISAHIVGRIEKIYAKEGQRIARGAPFIELERESMAAAREDWRARRAMAKSAEREAEARLQDARIETERVRRLNRESIASKEQLEQAELRLTAASLALDQAKESVLQAEAQLSNAENELQKTTIFAPISGRVVALNAEEGEVVVPGTMNNPGSVIATIADLAGILAEVDVSEAEIVDIEPGQKATIRVEALAETTLRGQVVETGSSGFAEPTSPDVTLFKVKVLLDEPDVRLRPGMTVRAEIETKTSPQALVVPIQAVVSREPKVEGAAEAKSDAGEEIDVVYVVEDGRAKQKPVQVGISDATGVEIRSGIGADDLVISGPYRLLKTLADGDRVKIEKEKPKSKKKDDDEKDEKKDNEKE